MRRLLMLVGAALTGVGTPAPTLDAQTFGRSKVQYDRFDFRVINTPHFAVYFYPAESLATADAARMAERWYDRHAGLLNHQFTNNPLIFYADHPDFQQSNVIDEQIGVGTGGVTEGMRDRVIMPFTGSYADNDHVLGHELVHVFQYRIAQSLPGGERNMMQIPLWLIEGMAEYLSIGREDPNTAMWLRDAARRNDLPTIRQLTTDPRYFPYRYGQALWAYIGGRWGDAMVNQLFRAALREGWEKALVSQLGMPADTLSRVWHEAIRQHYAPALARTAPSALGEAVIGVREPGDQNVAPAVSPDGQLVSFFSSRNLFGIELFVAEVATGRIVRQLTNITQNPHFSSLSFINSGGAWSPDGSQLAAVTFAQGDNEITIFDARSGRVRKRVRIRGVGGMADPAWSPDGRQLAFSGMKGGISDLYLYDLASGSSRQLTNDREAQLQPAWSPDGRTIAFATDADAATNFATLTYAGLRVATMDVESRQVTLQPRIGRGKAINPQYSRDGRSLYFVSDQDGVSDLYRLALADGQLFRVTTIATGVSGITTASPSVSVAMGTGDVVFSVFDRGGFAIRRLRESAAQGTRVTDLSRTIASAGLLPPPATSTVAESRSGSANGVLDLGPAEGNASWLRTPAREYQPKLALERVGGANFGATIGGGYGTGLGGGVMFGFGDMLGNRLLNAAVQLNGSVRDVGGQVLYLNRERRLNWGAVAQHIPLVGTSASYAPASVETSGGVIGGTVVEQVFQREYYDQVQGILQYPLSETRRLEFGIGAQRVSYGLQVDSLLVVNQQVIDQVSSQLPTPPALTFGSATAAFVGDYSFFGFTSPIAGGRYRFEVSPYAGSLNYGTVLADYRRYFFRRPFTFAMRGLHFGRYGPDADDRRMQQLFVGQNALIRGYDPSTFRESECSITPASSSTCPEYDRLNGTRVGVVNLELRIPLLGPEQLGLIRSTVLPIEIAPFVDAGVAWRKGQRPAFRFDQRTTERVPVFSAGITSRINLFGYAVIEAFWARPFQRPQRNGVFGFQLAPGW